MHGQNWFELCNERLKCIVPLERDASDPGSQGWSFEHSQWYNILRILLSSIIILLDVIIHQILEFSRRLNPVLQVDRFRLLKIWWKIFYKFYRNPTQDWGVIAGGKLADGQLRQEIYITIYVSKILWMEFMITSSTTMFNGNSRKLILSSRCLKPKSRVPQALVLSTLVCATQRTC